MEGNLSSGNMIQGGVGGGGSYGTLDLQAPIRIHHQNQNPLSLLQHHSHPRQGSSFADQNHRTVGLADFPKGEKGKNISFSDEDELSFAEDDVHNDPNRGKKGIQWHRVKWTDKMVKLLITAVSYIGEDANSEFASGGIRRKYANIQKKGKWKSVSKVMAERGHCVSPQQCEDKFNDLNKRYKRLNEILGRGTSCQVVERPELLERMDHVSDKAKDEVKKILSSKHLFYEEMCSYHNSNRLHLPHDPDLQRSLRKYSDIRDGNDDDEVEMDEDNDDDDDDEEFEDGGEGGNKRKKKKKCGGVKKMKTNCGSHQETIFSAHTSQTMDHHQVGMPAEEDEMKGKWMIERRLRLEEQKLEIQAQTLQLQQERYKWERFCKKKDRELEIMKMENERMKLENEHMALELKKRQLNAEFN